MPSEAISVRDWLEAEWREGQRLYVVMGNASEANPLQAYYQQDSVSLPLPIWSDTPYASWQEVMPYLGELQPDSSFFDWVDEAPSQDWGWLALSAHEPDLVLDHLRSLTQVLMPDGTEVFFRHWDGSHLLPILRFLSDAAGELLPVFDQLLINGQALSIATSTLPVQRNYPWWQVPQALASALTEENPSTLVDNLMQWLLEQHAELYFAVPQKNLRHKVERFVRRTPITEDNYSGRLRAHLEYEVTP
ncbi:DUF4123 domain-containing protein [Pseudomonas sp. PDM15]|uniref:DUF4123 domain-containing protein n=1 Tax=Pseudomonas sp. PDM15 TaxID=2769303 RepID=UPI001783585E|nr:DUF4123 domain-containing protein [Pseudomonas sp. PDM15]MBD9425937.1 DUF4123 domain-containing protein [Pseudomonas sp. PDM15]